MTHVAAEMEAAEIARGESDEGVLFTLNELRQKEEDMSPVALDRDLRLLHLAWKESSFPEQLQSRLANVKLASEFGAQAAAVLVKYYDEIQKHGS